MAQWAVERSGGIDFLVNNAAIYYGMCVEGPRNIRVNAIAPGPTDTEATRRVVDPAVLQNLLLSMPIGRLGSPEDLVGPLLFLLSDHARWITGHVLNVDGGQVMRA